MIALYISLATITYLAGLWLGLALFHANYQWVGGDGFRPRSALNTPLSRNENMFVEALYGSVILWPLFPILWVGWALYEGGVAFCSFFSSSIDKAADKLIQARNERKGRR